MRTERGLPFGLIDKVVKLDQIELLDTKPFQRSVQAIARALIRAIAGLGREEEALAMLAHPGTDAQFRFAIRRRSIDVVDAEFEQQFEHLIGLVLLHTAQRRGAEDDAGALMTGFAEGNLVDHFPPRRVAISATSYIPQTQRKRKNDDRAGLAFGSAVRENDARFELAALIFVARDADLREAGRREQRQPVIDADRLAVRQPNRGGREPRKA